MLKMKDDDDDDEDDMAAGVIDSLQMLNESICCVP